MNRLESRIHSLSIQSGDLQTSLHQNSVTQDTIVQNLHQRIPILQQQSTTDQYERSTEQVSNVQEPITRLLAAQQRMELKLDAVIVNSPARAESDISFTMQSPTLIRNLPGQLANMTTVRISTSMSPYLCWDTCNCVCHRRKTRRTPRFSDRVLGTLFLGYTGIPYITPQCDKESCTKRSSPVASVMYLFPSWLLARALILVLRLSSINGLEFSLRAPCIVSRTASIWDISMKGDIEGMRRLLSQQISSPFVMDYYGATPLSVRRVRVIACYKHGLISRF